MWNVSAWLNDAENTPPIATRVAKEARDDRSHSYYYKNPHKRQRLSDLSANKIYLGNGVSMPRTPSPNKQHHLRSSKHLHNALDVADTDETTMRTPMARYSRWPPSNTVDSDNRFATHFLPPLNDDMGSHASASASASSHSTKRSTRSKSPIKDAVDLRLADISIRYCRRGQVSLPKSIDDLCEELDTIAEGNELVPGDIWDQMQQRGESKLKVRHRSPPDAEQDLLCDDQHDFRQLCDILKDALRQEDDNTSEASWNAEVHAPVLRVALRPYEEALYFHNITTAKPVSSWVPTRALQASESRLVDYSINFNPSSKERDVIEGFLKREPYGHATITQTMYAAVRERPCIASIETKTVSEFDKAKNQLAVWAAAHIARLREFATSEEEDQLLLIHPVIHVQHHLWKIYFAIAKPEGNSVDIVNINVTIGATDSLLDLWKLVKCLRCLASWAQSVYRKAFFSCVKKCNAKA